MIGQAIETIVMTAIAYSGVTQTINRSANYKYLSNLLAQNTYDPTDNTTLTEREVYQIQEWEDISYGSLGNLRIRGIQQYIKRPQTDEYHIRSYLIFNTNVTTVQIDRIIDEFNLNTYVPYTNYDEKNMYLLYAQTLTNQSVIDFLEGATYTNFNDIKAVYNTINGLQKYQYNDEEYLGSIPSTMNFDDNGLGGYVDTVFIKTELDMYATLQDGGAQFETIQPNVRTINNTVTYTTQDVPPTYEVIDLPGLMFEILGMPFAWLSTAFNLTLFPGTMYAINIADIIMAILGALILIVIVKKVIK